MSKATSSPKATPAPDTVGVSFVKQYYHVMQTLPDLMYKFYKKYANWTYEDASNGTNLKAKGIDDFLKKWKSCPTRGATTDFSRNGHLMFQEINSSDNVSRGIFIMVHGEMTMDGQSSSRMFQQSFLLEKEGDKGYSLTNDCFRFLPPVSNGTAAAAAATTAAATKKSVVSKPTKKKQAAPAAAPTAAPATSAPVATKTTPPPTVAATAAAAPTPASAAPAQQSTKSKKGKPRTKGKPAASNNKKTDTTPATESTGPSKPKTWASMATGPTTTAFKPLRKGPTAPNTTTNNNGNNGNNGNNNGNNGNNGNSNGNNNSGNSNNGNNNSGNNNSGNNNNNNGKKEGRGFEPGKVTHSLYVTGCPDGVTDKQVRDVFAPFGPIKEVVLQKGYIFVVYKDSVSAGKALEQRDRLKISNRTLKVDRKSSTKGGKNNNKGGNGKSGKQRNRGGGRGGRGGNKGGNKGGNNGDSKK